MNLFPTPPDDGSLKDRIMWMIAVTEPGGDDMHRCASYLTSLISDEKMQPGNVAAFTEHWKRLINAYDQDCAFLIQVGLHALQMHWSDMPRLRIMLEQRRNHQADAYDVFDIIEGLNHPLPPSAEVLDFPGSGLKKPKR